MIKIVELSVILQTCDRLIHCDDRKDNYGNALKCYYRPQRSWGKVMFSQACVILFTREACVVAGGGHAWLPGGYAWLLGGHAWLLGGMHGCQGVCGCWGVCMVKGACIVKGAYMAKGGVHGEGGHVWDMMRYRDTINERAVHILLECILV